MTFTLTRAADHTETPWKNGQGTTRQLAIFPFEAKFPEDPFLWRLSSANINSSGPFSRFPGYERVLCVLRGEGLELGGKSLGPYEFFTFSGDADVSSQLRGGSVQDFNIIYDPKDVHVTYEFLFTEQWTSPALTLNLDSDFSFLFCVEGEVELKYSNQKIGLKTGDTLLVDNESEAISLASRLQVSRKSPNSVLIYVRIAISSRK